MTLFGSQEFSRIRNRIRNRRPQDFDFSLFGFLLVIALASAGLFIRFVLPGGLQQGFALRIILTVSGVSVLYAVWPHWVSVILGVLALSIAVKVDPIIPVIREFFAYQSSPYDIPSIAFAAAAVALGPAVLVVQQWDKIVILRLGRYRRTIGPGVHFLTPLLDRCSAFVDTRIRVTDFSAEKILTSDTVPVHIDALAFWMIWDAAKSVLEVENFLEAVTLSAQTALRDSIGKYSLTTLLTERETLYREIQGILDAKTNPWGITILSVEFTDIVLPQELEGVMSAQAQAEREKLSRKILSEAEAEVASQFVRAAQIYEENPHAMELRGMNMIYEAMKKQGGMVMVPASALESMKIGGVSGIAGLAKSAAGGAAAQSAQSREGSLTSADEPAAIPGDTGAAPGNSGSRK